MDNIVDLKKDVFDKSQYIKTIDTGFNELGISSIAEDINSQVNVDDFFIYYNELFYDIPPNGSLNSHEYLVKTSSEYINFDENNSEIEALREEINQLRKDLLDEQIKNAKLTTEKIQKGLI
jgi:hypothetical protein